MNYVYSTLTCDNIYADYEKSGHLNVRVKEVLIKGKANVAQPGLMAPITHAGSVTVVDDEQMALLKRNQHFLDHVERGFIRYEESQKKPEQIEKVIEREKMTKKDGSAPKVRKDLEDTGTKEYKLNT